MFGECVSTKTRSSATLRWGVGISALVIVGVDQLTKWWAESALELREYHPVIGDLLGWRLVYNPGAAFGLASNYTWVLTIFAAVAVVGLVIFALRIPNAWWGIGVACLLGGAISHLGDRLFREPGFGRGHIVDFIDYGGFFVGNVADIVLVGGAIYCVALSVLAEVRQGKRDERPPQES
jgi:signal peptidase II